jgi:hypothetical protein
VLAPGQAVATESGVKPPHSKITQWRQRHLPLFALYA